MTATAVDFGRVLLARIRDRDRSALSTAMTEVQRGSAVGECIVAELVRAPRRAAVVGITGPPGAGKSTLVGSLVAQLLADDRRTGVLLIDPSSATSGGALLADRVRMRQHIGSTDLFVRSVASRGHAGGLSSCTAGLVCLLDAWGADLIIVETVGAGQGEIDVCRAVDVTSVVCPPGLGDDLQAMKAGVMEIADLFVVNKADRPGAERTAAGLARAGHGGRHGQPRRVLLTTATTGDGIDELIVEIDRLFAQAPNPMPDRAEPRLILAAEAAKAVHRLVMSSADLDDILAAVTAGRLDPATAGQCSLRRLIGS